MKYTRTTMAKMLKCCERTLHRASMSGDILPCESNPVMYDDKDVIELMNFKRKGCAKKLDAIPDDLVSTAGLAGAVGVLPSTVRKWMCNCGTDGIPHYRLSQTWVLYSANDVSKWMLDKAKKIEKQKKKRHENLARARKAYAVLSEKRGRKVRL
jgi:hypothetical protein